MNYQNMLVTLKAQVTPELVENIEKLIKKMEEERDTYRDQLLDTRHELMQKDYVVENQMKIIEDNLRLIDRYKVENKALRELVGLWI